MYDPSVTFLEAIRKGKWVRRKGTKRVYCLSETPTDLYRIRRSDFLANDWELVGEDGPEEEEKDSTTQRFALMELD